MNSKPFDARWVLRQRKGFREESGFATPCSPSLIMDVEKNVRCVLDICGGQEKIDGALLFPGLGVFSCHAGKPAA